jgi:hypothetical protein
MKHLTLPVVFLFALAMALGLAICLYAPAHAADAGPAVVSSSPAASPAVVSIDADPVGWARGLYDAVRTGAWPMAAGLALIGVVWAGRRWGGALLPWLKTDRGGVALVLATSTLGALGTAWAAGAAPDGKAALAALQVGLLAIGGYTGLRKLIWPADRVKGDG